MDALPPVVTQEIRIVDAQGHLRMLLSAAGGTPVIRVSRADGSTAIEATLDASGHPSVTLTNPDPAGPVAALEVDDKGAHVKLDRPGKASSYLFLNNAGTSGLVLVDPRGVRRYEAIVDPDGQLHIDASVTPAATAPASSSGAK
jgi:hypothetical protein